MPKEELSLKRKYQVFISSTFKDLREHRQEAIQALVKVGQIPLALENFTPRTDSQVEVFESAIRDCQFYVILLGHRYGSIDPISGKSYTEVELDLAEKSELKILVFLLKKRLADDLRKKLDPENERDHREIENYGKYLGLRERLLSGSWYHKSFEKPSDVREDLCIYFSGDHNVPGYILEPKDEEQADLLELYVKNKIVREIVQRLGQFDEIEPRFSVAQKKKKALGQAFVELFGDYIQRYTGTIFIESGSTLAYVAKALSGRLPKLGTSKASEVGPRVITNNAFAYLYLWICEGVLCHPQPDGPPGGKYGGMYGPLTDRTRRPDYSRRPVEELDIAGARIVETVRHQVFPPGTDPSKSIILAATSGLQLADEIDYGDDQVPEGTRELVDRCRGFHVGSYSNMLFKRCLYGSRIPMVVMLHDDKVDCPVRVNECHFILDDGLPWETLIREYPIAIWVACHKTTWSKIEKKFKEHFERYDWKVAVYAGTHEFPIVVGQSPAFLEACDDLGFLPSL